MKNKIGFLPGLVLMALFASMPARANMIITVGSAVVTKGSVGNSLDVTLTNTGPGAQNIAGFNFEISTADADITFTSVNISTVLTYIFNGDSLFGPTISAGTPHPGPGQIIDASDLSLAGTGTNLASGQTLGLGHVLFNISNTAALGGFPVTLNTGTPGATSLADSAGANVVFTGANGTITINPSGVPEPSTALLMLLALPALAIVRRRYR